MNVDINSIEKKSIIVIILVLIILSLVIYWPVQNYEFIDLDDQLYTTDTYSQIDNITLKDITNAFTDIQTIIGIRSL
jgi:hypothetical protein